MVRSIFLIAVSYKTKGFRNNNTVHAFERLFPYGFLFQWLVSLSHYAYVEVVLWFVSNASDLLI